MSENSNNFRFRSSSQSDHTPAHLFDPSAETTNYEDEFERLFWSPPTNAESVPPTNVQPIPAPPSLPVLPSTALNNKEEEKVVFVTRGRSELLPEFTGSKRERRSESRPLAKPVQTEQKLRSSPPTDSQAFSGVIRAKHEMIVNRMCDMLQENINFTPNDARTFQKLCVRREAILQEAPEFLRPILLSSEPSSLKAHVTSVFQARPQMQNQLTRPEFLNNSADSIPSVNPCEINVQMLQARGLYPSVLEPSHQNELRRLNDWYKLANDQQRADFNAEPQRYVIKARETNYGMSSNTRQSQMMTTRPTNYQFYQHHRQRQLNPRPSLPQQTSFLTTSIQRPSPVYQQQQLIVRRSTSVPFSINNPGSVRLPIFNLPRPRLAPIDSRTERIERTPAVTEAPNRLQSFDELSDYLAQRAERIGHRQPPSESHPNKTETPETCMSDTKNIDEYNTQKQYDAPAYMSLYTPEMLSRVESGIRRTKHKIENKDNADGNEDKADSNAPKRIIGLNCSLPIPDHLKEHEAKLKYCVDSEDIKRHMCFIEGKVEPTPIVSLEEAERLTRTLIASPDCSSGSEQGDDDPWTL